MALLIQGWAARAKRILGCAALAAVWLASGAAQAEEAPLEFAVKASYLYKFAPFVTWPTTAFPAADSPFNLCVVGDDPFGPVLDEVTKGQAVQTHPIVVRRMATASAGMNCQILFIGHSDAQSPEEMLHAVAGEPVLTVTDRSRGVGGGIIQFVMRDGRVRFDIDPAAASANGVSISSKLLDLALRRRD